MTRVGFLLLPDFPLIPFSAGIEALRLSNRHTGKTLYEWVLLSESGLEVSTSSGIAIRVDGSLEHASDYDLLIVVAGAGAENYNNRHTTTHLQRLARRGTRLAAVTLGSFVLAQAGLLDGYRCTVHWEYLDTFRERFSHLDVSKEVFEIDRARLTCSGGTAALDMVLSYIGMEHDWTLAQDVAELVIHDRVRHSSEPQRMPLNLRLGVRHTKLLSVIELMEQSLDSPISADTLGIQVGLSGRQLERLFRKYLDTTPKKYHLDIRLARARHLLRQSTMSVLDVAVACGFSTASHFTRTYREHFGLTPRQERPPGVA